MLPMYASVHRDETKLYSGAVRLKHALLPFHPADTLRVQYAQMLSLLHVPDVKLCLMLVGPT